ncbi:MAG: (d)CMP kinase [Ruminococcaceae bacterium]|nr:(d)CMP kinase [Oscillospiraceae bacterium]
MFKIAIDGPSGSGKSFLAKAIAKELGYIYVDTGALYRAVGLYVFRKGLDPKNADEVISVLSEIKVELKYIEDGQRVLLNGEDVSSDIRINEISMYASDVSKIPEVRAFLLDLQRNMAKEYNVVMDGRDIGTVIMPDAEVKFFLFANNRKRAERRHLELLEKGMDVSVEQLLAEMEERDRNDSQRKIAPAIPAEDAMMFDNSELTREETVEKALRIIREKMQ